MPAFSQARLKRRRATSNGSFSLSFTEGMLLPLLSLFILWSGFASREPRGADSIHLLLTAQPYNFITCGLPLCLRQNPRWLLLVVTFIIPSLLVGRLFYIG